MDLKSKLVELNELKRTVEEQITDIYKKSLDAPKEEKVCDDFFASMLTEKTRGFIEYPITVTGITIRPNNDPVDRRANDYPGGTWVAVRPAQGGDTYLGVYLGRIALSFYAGHHKETGVFELGFGMYNPAMWVPDLNRIVFGAESWWGAIKGPDDLKKITNQDIQNVWYVKALNELSGPAAGAVDQQQ